jgi:hypothetical protein
MCFYVFSFKILYRVFFSSFYWNFVYVAVINLRNYGNMRQEKEEDREVDGNPTLWSKISI